MSRFFGFFLRSDEGRAQQARLRAAAALRLGVPAYSDRSVSLWESPGSCRTPSQVPVVAVGRVHNRDEIAGKLGVGATPGDDRELLGRAFAAWGEKACGPIHGDWAAALWNPHIQQLILARDPYGNSSLYYHHSPDFLIFGTSQEDIAALDVAPALLDELYLGQMLVSWSAYHGERTANRSINRLPPAHFARVTSGKMDTCCYWRLEDAPPIRLARQADYVERFSELFGEAVRQRLPADGKVAATLSSGLDSGSVAVTAAPFLAESGRRLSAYVSTPIADPRAFIGSGIGDEYPLAAQTAEAGRTINLHRVDAATVSPIAAMRDMLEIVRGPQQAAGGVYWLLDVFRRAARDGNGTVLTGQMGNCGVSWTGDATSFPIRRQIALFGLSHMAKLRVRRMLPWPVEREYRRLRRREGFASSAIRLEFARKLNLVERMDDDRWSGPYPRARDERLRGLKPGALNIGAFYAQVGAATGVHITDPTADPRLLEFCLSIPDSVFVDPATGMHRSLIREAMKGRLPDPVRLNTRLGRQSGDLVHRLREHADDVDQALEEIENGAGGDVVDVDRMRAIWRRIQTEDSYEALALAITHTTRGIMAGLFVNGFGTRY